MSVTDKIYSNHREQFLGAAYPDERSEGMLASLTSAFDSHVESRQVEYILFDEIPVETLAKAFFNCPNLIKAISSSVNLESRVVKHELEMNSDTFTKSISTDTAGILAGYINAMHSKEMTVSALVELGRCFWTDKQMCKNKCKWEKKIPNASALKFKKHKILFGSEEYELDATTPEAGENIDLGIDVKRIEAKQYIHKRIDEFVNKASKFKACLPTSNFFAVVYYTFPFNPTNLQTRNASSDINRVFFTDESIFSIQSTVEHLSSMISPLSK